MGFFKFLKRDKSKGVEELDLPPEPPKLEEGFGDYPSDDNLPKFPDFPDFGEEKISAADEFPKFDFHEDKNSDFGSSLEFPSFPETEEKSHIETISAPPLAAEASVQPMQKQEQTAVQEPSIGQDEYPKTEKRLFSHEKSALKERPIGKTIYIRIDMFKATLTDINTVRSDFKKSEESIAKLENIKSLKDKSLEKAKIHLEDLQKKLIFIDKTLFKGE